MTALSHIRYEDTEIMAPAGSRESLAAAIEAGADSIYFGVGELNMRAGSSSAFTVDDLVDVANFCHERGVKCYLTVNIIIYDQELDEMRALVRAAKQAGIDAIIAADVSVIQACVAEGIAVHLSTQMNISNKESLRFYAQFAQVAVLARELTLEQVADIQYAIEHDPICGPDGHPVRIEMFCHGAFCMAISGKCFMSLHTRGKSANRGLCLQNCRRSYVLKDQERGTELQFDNEYIMSPKDLKTIDFVDQMLAAGVRVFKIEGRARGPEYVAQTVRCYKEAVRAAIDGTFTSEKVAEWNQRLAEVFNRGFWDGYYLGRKVAELTEGYGSRATTKKRFVGKVLKYYPKAGVAHLLLQAGDISAGSRLMITGITTGVVDFVPEQLICDEVPLEVAQKGQDITVQVPARVRENDKLYVVEERTLEDLAARRVPAK